MARVAPSILAADFAALAQDCRRVMDETDPLLHFDVMDGVFVPNLSVGVPVLQSLKKALPEAACDVHLMVLRPHQFISAFAQAGAAHITFHLEAQSPIGETARAIRACGCKAGLSLRPGTPVEWLFPHLEEIDQVLVMSVEPGFGGQAFLPDAPGRIAALRREALRRSIPLTILVDGGINPATGPLCVRAGADILVAGSAVFGAQNPREAMRAMVQIQG